MYNNLQKYYPRFLFIAKLLIVVFAYRIISEKISDHGSYTHFLLRLEELKGWSVPFVLFLIGMTLINWFVEIKKWQVLVKSILPISFIEAFKQSLASLTVSLLTPNRIGEYGAKALYFKSEERSKVILYNFLGNFSQMTATLLFGVTGFWLIHLQQELAIEWIVSWKKIAVWSLVLFLGLVLLKKLWKNFYSKMIRNLQSVSPSIQLKVFLFSILRYLIFSHQFYFLLRFFGVDLDYILCMSLISSTYLIASLIPGFVVFDWLVKGSVAVVIFGQFGISEIVVLSITGIMWMLNFALPSALGTFYVLTFQNRSSPLASRR